MLLFESDIVKAKSLRPVTPAFSFAVLRQIIVRNLHHISGLQQNHNSGNNPVDFHYKMDYIINVFGGRFV